MLSPHRAPNRPTRMGDRESVKEIAKETANFERVGQMFVLPLQIQRSTWYSRLRKRRLVPRKERTTTGVGCVQRTTVDTEKPKRMYSIGQTIMNTMEGGEDS